MVRRVPGKPFTPEEYVLESGAQLYRVFNNGRMGGVTEFNPGFGAASRFAFFGVPKIPVLYAADTEEAAICESILHDVPPGPARVLYDSIADKICASLAPSRDLRLVSLMGDGLRKLQTESHLVTATPASQYRHTVRWAEAAHQAGFDGLVWMSNRRNTDRTYVFFGDKVGNGDFMALPGQGRIFAAGKDFDWLADYLAGLNIDILIP